MNLRPLLVLLLVAAAGCGSDAPPADKARPVDDGGPKALDLPPVAGPKPPQSEPAAATLVNSLLMAHTDSQPSRVDKLKKVYVRRTGTGRLIDEGGQAVQSKATMDIHIWGDQYRATYAVEAKQNAPETFALNGTSGWMLLPGAGAKPLVIPPEAMENVLPDVRGDRLLFLFPLADPHLTAVVARDALAGDAVLRVWVGDAAPVLLSVDAKTNRLKRITYEAKITGQSTVRSLELSDLEPVAGVLLPKRVAYSVGPVLQANWTTIEYEVPGVFELSVFDKP